LVYQYNKPFLPLGTDSNCSLQKFESLVLQGGDVDLNMSFSSEYLMARRGKNPIRATVSMKIGLSDSLLAQRVLLILRSTRG